VGRGCEGVQGRVREGEWGEEGNDEWEGGGIESYRCYRARHRDNIYIYIYIYALQIKTRRGGQRRKRKRKRMSSL
jgi:hypothetical protein